MILEKIDQLLEEVKNISATNADEIEALRLKYLSKKGAITALMNDFRNVPADQKKAVKHQPLMGDPTVRRTHRYHPAFLAHSSPPSTSSIIYSSFRAS